MPSSKLRSLVPSHCSLVTAFLSSAFSLRSLVTGHMSLPFCTLYAIRYTLYAAIILVTGHWSLVTASDFAIRPTIAVSEEYNDNVFEEPNKTTDYITRLMPGITFGYAAPFWDWDLAYNYDYRIYAQRTHKNDDTHNLNTTGHLRLIDDFLLMDINDTYSRVSLDISRDRTQESLIADQSDSNNFTASPYLQFHPNSQATVKIGYRYNNVWYSEASAIDRRDHIGYLDVSYEFSPQLTLNANYTFTHESSTEGYDRHTSYVGGRYEYGERSFISANGGYTISDYKDSGNSGDPYWNAGITHSFDHSSVSLTTSVTYPTDPLSGTSMETVYTLAFNKELARGTAGLTLRYSEFSGTEIDAEKSYGAGITLRHELLPNLSGSLSCNVDKYEHADTGTYTRRILVNSSLSYTLPREFTIGLNSTFVDSYSPETLEDRYQVNRVSLELRKSFGREVERVRLATSDP
jgi:hypothetical protein